jgi:hypothetical protein
MMTTYSPDPLQGRICRDDQDTVTVTAREDPSERAGKKPAEALSLRGYERSRFRTMIKIT